MRKASPEQNALWQTFNFGQNGSARRGEARDGFKKSADHVGNRTADYEGDRAEDGHQQPRARNADEALFCENFSILGLEEDTGQGAHNEKPDGDEKGVNGFAVQQGNQQRKDEKSCFDQQGDTEEVSDHFRIHINGGCP